MLQVNLDPLRITRPAEVRPAAEQLKVMAWDLARLRVAICHNIAVKAPMLDDEGNILATDVFGWTEEGDDRWWCTPCLALESPLTTACRYESEPFWCNAQGFRTRLGNPLLNAIDLRNFERRSLTAAAIVIPVHLPYGQIGAASYMPQDRSKTDMADEFAAFGDVLGLMTRTFIAGYVRVMCNPERLPVGTILSRREVECLRWAAIGKTDCEISLIMSRSRATVRFHIHNASLKLNAVNRSQTLFKAAQLGYIRA